MCECVCVCVLVRLHLIWFIKNKTHFCWNFKYHKSGTFFVRSFAEGSVLYGEFDKDMVNCSMGCYNVLKAIFIQMLLIRFYFICSNLTLNEVKEIDFLNSSDRYTCVYTLNIAPNLMESNSYPRAHLAAWFMCLWSENVSRAQWNTQFYASAISLLPLRTPICS